jgi:curved DNA-binding protein CbpA
MLNHYATLGIKSSATEDEINKAFHTKALQFHPDKLQKILKQKDRTEKEIEIIKEINAKKYAELKKSYTELTENREDYDLILKNQTDYSIIKNTEEVIIKKIDLVSNYDEDKFNELFMQINKKETEDNDENKNKISRNVNKALAELMAERDVIECDFIPNNKFDINVFNNTFFNNDETNIACDEEKKETATLCEYTEAYNTNSLAEISENGLLNMPGVSLTNLHSLPEQIICTRKLSHLSQMTYNYNDVM